jgi:hypothetical protein
MTGFTERDLANFKNIIAIMKKMTLPNTSIMECGSAWLTLKWAEEMISVGHADMKAEKDKQAALAAISTAKPVELPFEEPMKSVTKQKKKK